MCDRHTSVLLRNVWCGGLLLGQTWNLTRNLAVKATHSTHLNVYQIFFHVLVATWKPSYYYIIIYCWLTAQSTAQGHLRVFHKFKFHTQVDYNTKHAHYTNVKHNPKGSPFGIALVKMANKVRRCWYHWPFQSGISIDWLINWLL